MGRRSYQTKKKEKIHSGQVPKSDPARLESIKQLFKKGRESRGFAELERYLAEYPHDPNAHCYKGAKELRRNNLAAAEASFEIAANAHTNIRHQGLTGLARVHKLRGDIESAENYYQQAIAYNPHYKLLPYLALAQLRREEEDYYGALNILRAAQELPDKDADEFDATQDDVKLAIVKNLISIGRSEEAEEELNSITPATPRARREFEYQLGNLALERARVAGEAGETVQSEEHYEDAKSHFIKVREMGQNDKIYYQSTLNLARTCRKLGDDAGQKAYFEELYNANRYFDGEVPATLGVIRLVNKDYTGAKRCFAQTLHANAPSYRNNGTYNYVCLQLLEGEVAEAERALRESIGADEGNREPDRLNYIMLIRLLFDQKRYAEAEACLAELAAKDADIDAYIPYKRMKLQVALKQGKSVSSRLTTTYSGKQIVNYSEEAAIAEVIAKHTNNIQGTSNFSAKIDIRELFSDVKLQLSEDTQLIGTVFDEYEIPYPNAGYMGEQIFHTLRVKTLPGTHQIITINPCDVSHLPTKGAYKAAKQAKQHQETSMQKVKGESRTDRFNKRFGL